MANFIEAIFHLEKRELKRLAHEADQVIALDEKMTALTDDELRAKTQEFKARIAAAPTDEAKDKILEEIKIEAFAVAREAAWRTLKQKPFKVQIIGSLVLNGGNIAEMRTGEGKTLTATMAVYLNALKGEGVHRRRDRYLFAVDINLSFIREIDARKHVHKSGLTTAILS